MEDEEEVEEGLEGDPLPLVAVEERWWEEEGAEDEEDDATGLELELFSFPFPFPNQSTPFASTSLSFLLS